MTADEINVLANGYLAKWQPKLHLGDWRIGVIVDGGGTDDNCACSHHCNLPNLTCTIDVPADIVKRCRDASAAHPLDTDEDIIEFGIVHELVHLMEHPYGRDVEDSLEWLVGKRSPDSGVLGDGVLDYWRNYRETWINRVVRVLIEQDRGQARG